MPRRQITPFGKKIKKKLIEKNMTQCELAKAVGTTPQSINNIIYGFRSGESYKERIAAVLEMDLNKKCRLE